MGSEPSLSPVAAPEHRARDDPNRLLAIDGHCDLRAPQPTTREKRCGPIDRIDRPDAASRADRPLLLAQDRVARALAREKVSSARSTARSASRFQQL